MPFSRPGYQYVFLFGLWVRLAWREGQCRGHIVTVCVLSAVSLHAHTEMVVQNSFQDLSIASLASRDVFVCLNSFMSVPWGFINELLGNRLDSSRLERPVWYSHHRQPDLLSARVKERHHAIVWPVSFYRKSPLTHIVGRTRWLTRWFCILSPVEWPLRESLVFRAHGHSNLQHLTVFVNWCSWSS